MRSAVRRMNHAPSFYAQSGANITEVLQWGHCTSRESRCVTAGFVTGNYRFLLLLFLILQLLGRQLMRRAYVDMALHVPELYALTFGSAVRVASADPYEAGFGAYAELRTLVRDASRSGLEPDLVTLMLWAMMHGSVMLVIAGHTEPDLHLDDPLNLVGHAASALLEITLPVETRRQRQRFHMALPRRRMRIAQQLLARQLQCGQNR
jgi:hypothetical protein